MIETDDNESYDDLTDKSHEEDVRKGRNKTDSEKSVNPGYNLRRKFINTHINEGSSTEEEEEGSTPVKIKNTNLNQIKYKPSYYKCKKCFEKFWDFTSLKKHREGIHCPKSKHTYYFFVCLIII